MTQGPRWVPVLILFALLGLAYLAMWRGWRRRAGRHDLPPLVEVGAPGSDADVLATAGGTYVGTTVAGQWLDRVVARGLGSRSGVRLVLSGEGLDVHRPRAAFRIPRTELRDARLESGLAGKVVPPHGILVVTWEHGGHLLDSGFRLDTLVGPQEAARSRSAREIQTELAARVTSLVCDVS